MDDAKSVNDEEWFYYWRVTSSLWKERIANFKGPRIIVPINWGVHQIDEFHFDFGTTRKETNLKKLSDLAEEANKKIIFYLPLTPAPFLPDGGIPEFLKTCLSINKEGLLHTSIDSEGNINKLYSFFDSHIYRAFSFFVKKLGEYIKNEKINSDFWGVNCGRLQEGKFNSYIEDYSPLFHKSFGQYIEAIRESDKNYVLKTPEEELIQIKKFKLFILDLYRKVAKEGIGGNWEGDLKLAILGGNPMDFIKRCLNCDEGEFYSDELREGIYQGLMPTSILLDKKSKESFRHQLNDILLKTYLPEKLDPPLNEDESYNYTLLSFFNVYKSPISKEDIWQKNGLLKFLEGEFKWVYNYHFEDYYYPEFEEENKVNILPSDMINQKVFQHILRSFMEGGKFILDKNNLDEKLARKLDIFVLENSIRTEKLKFFSEIQNITLGEGRIMLFDGEIIANLADNQKVVFWDKIINTFHLTHLKFNYPDKIDHFWRTRMVSPSEIKFKELRRLQIYNNGNNKKNFKVKLGNNISLIKISSESNGVVRTKPHSFEVELNPKGSIGIDFGIWS